MSEDVSATMRVGITVILVAALVATVLNLMVMSNSLLSGGQSTLQSGIDSVSQQEFAGFNNVRVTGTQVLTALNLFQGRDIAILVQTKAIKNLDKTTYTNTYLNYGALLTKDGSAASGTMTTGNCVVKLEAPQNGVAANIVGDTAKTAFLAKVIKGTTRDNETAAYQANGDAFYRGTLFSENGLVQSNYETGGTTQLGNAQYILSSARFNSVLIKDNSDAIIGILFTQID